MEPRLTTQYVMELIKGVLIVVLMLVVPIAIIHNADRIVGWSGHGEEQSRQNGENTGQTLEAEEEIARLLESGEYDQANHKLDLELSLRPDHPGLNKLYEDLRQSVGFSELSFFWEEFPDNWRSMNVEKVNPQTVRLETGAGYGLRFAPEQDCHLYIFQMNSSGRTWLIFPNDDERDWNTQPEAFLKAGETYQVPRPECAYSLVGAAGTERLILVSDRWRCLDIEKLYPEYRSERDSTGPRPAKRLRDQLLQRIRKRKNDGLGRAFFREFSFEHLAVE